MEKDEVVYVMVESINADNRELCAKAGMSEADAESQIQQSQPSLQFIMSNVYDKLKEIGIISNNTATPHEIPGGCGSEE